MEEQDLDPTGAALQIGISQPTLWYLRHRKPTRPINRETAEKLARWDPRWTPVFYRRWSTRTPEEYAAFIEHGRALGASGKGRPKATTQVMKMQTSRARTMTQRHGTNWPRWLKNKMVAGNRARKGMPGSRRSPEVGQKIATKLKGKDPLYYQATGGLRRLTMTGQLTPTTLLDLQDRVSESADAIAVVQRAIDRQRGRRPTWSPSQIRGWLHAGRSVHYIAGQLGVSDRQARRILARARGLEPAD